MNFDAVTTCTNMECEHEGERLVGYVVDDGERHWVWARSERDAILVVAQSLFGDVSDETLDATYERECDLSVSSDILVCQLTEEVLSDVKFRDDDGNTLPMSMAMRAQPRRGVVASSLY